MHGGLVAGLSGEGYTSSNENFTGGWKMAEPWREITIDVEPRGKEFRIAVDRAATAGDLIRAVEGRCKEEGVSVGRWASEQVGRDYQFVLMRRSQGNTLVAPTLPLSDLSPQIVEGEQFVFGTQPVVGALPVEIFNRRIEHLVEAFFEEGLPEVEPRRGSTPVPF